MAMKALSFLWCGFIVLSLFAGRAGAQSDSLNLRLYLQGDGIGYYFEGESGTLTSNNTSIYRHVPDSLNIVSIDNATCDLSFSVDTISSMIRDLQIGRGIPPEMNEYGVWIGGSEEYFFDSLPFVGKWKDGLEVPGKVYNVLDSWTIYSGLQQFSGTTIQGDSLYFELSPNNLDVSVSRENRTIFSVNPSGNMVDFYFNSSFSSRYFEVVNMLGRVLFKSTILPGNVSQELLQSQFTPGIYFARLGDQVAKFVVPPR